MHVVKRLQNQMRFSKILKFANFCISVCNALLDRIVSEFVLNRGVLSQNCIVFVTQPTVVKDTVQQSNFSFALINQTKTFDTANFNSLRNIFNILRVCEYEKSFKVACKLALLMEMISLSLWNKCKIFPS